MYICIYIYIWFLNLRRNPKVSCTRSELNWSAWLLEALHLPTLPILNPLGFAREPDMASRTSLASLGRSKLSARLRLALVGCSNLALNGPLDPASASLALRVLFGTAGALELALWNSNGSQIRKSRSFTTENSRSDRMLKEYHEVPNPKSYKVPILFRSKRIVPEKEFQPFLTIHSAFVLPPSILVE